jgi:hypothetical protein
VERVVRVVLNSIFGIEDLDKSQEIHQFLRIGLASHLIHWDAYESPVGGASYADYCPTLLADSVLRNTPIFTNP